MAQLIPPHPLSVSTRPYIVDSGHVELRSRLTHRLAPVSRLAGEVENLTQQRMLQTYRCRLIPLAQHGGHELLHLVSHDLGHWYFRQLPDQGIRFGRPLFLTPTANMDSNGDFM